MTTRIGPRRSAADIEREIKTLQVALADAGTRRAELEARVAAEPPGPWRYRTAVAAMAFAGLALGPFVHAATGAIRHAMMDRGCDAHAMPADTVITLQRTGCFGNCPAYTVSVHADGTVDYDGLEWVANKGHASAKVPVDDVRGLYELIARSCFFKMKDHYRYPVTDNPTAVVTVGGGTTKTVEHYPAGVPGQPDDPSCAPSSLTRIEQRIDEVSRAPAWFGRSDYP